MNKRNIFCQKELLFAGIAAVFLLGGCGKNTTPPEESVPEAVPEAAQTQLPSQSIESGAAPEPEKNAAPTAVCTEEFTIRCFHEDIDMARALHRCQSDGQNIYLAYSEPDLYIMPVGSEEQYRANLDNPDGLSVCNVALDTDSKLHILLSDEKGEKWFIWKLDQDYRTEQILDVSECFETKQIPIWFLVDRDGDYYLQWPLTRNGALIDQTGRLQQTITLSALKIHWIYEAAVDRDGQIVLVYSTDDRQIKLGTFDKQNAGIICRTPGLTFSADETFSAMYQGLGTHLLLFSPYSGVWIYDAQEELLENRTAIAELDFSGAADFWPLVFLRDGRLVFLGKPEDGIQNEVLLKYVSIEK